MQEYESLWEQLLDHLSREGLLSVHSLRLTPAEIAADVAAKASDNRVHRFVWGYYYPTVFGNITGSISENDARTLVASFQRPPVEEDYAPIEDESIPNLEVPIKSQPNCRVCGKRRPMVEEVR